VGSWLVGSLVTGMAVTLAWLFFTEVLPKMAARRAFRALEQPLTTLPAVEGRHAIDAEKSFASSKHTHDVFVGEAADLVRQSRGAGLFTTNLLEQAADKVADAVKLRPGSFAANLLAGEIRVKRAMLSGDSDAVTLLEEAAAYFATASDAKRGIIDAYVGRGWAHLERAYRLDGDEAVAAYFAAAEAFDAGFSASPQNLFVLRGWGLSIDGATRLLGDDAASVQDAEATYRLALAEHRGGDHELHDWYATLRSADEPARAPMPALRDLD